MKSAYLYRRTDRPPLNVLSSGVKHQPLGADIQGKQVIGGEDNTGLRGLTIERLTDLVQFLGIGLVLFIQVRNEFSYLDD